MISLGCAKNLVDSEVMLGHLERAGCVLVRELERADVIVVNTCGFIDAAREESVQTILEAAELKRSGNLQRLVVAGCLVQRHRDELSQSLPEVDAFVGLDELDQVLSATGPGEAQGAASYLYDHATPRRRATPAWTAFVKIAEGCDHTCAFCAIPAFRGGFRSRQPDSVLQEVRTLTSQGVREVNLIAQDSGHFGRDLGLREGLAELLEQLDAVRGLRWLRVHYLYPNTVTEHLVQTMARLPRVVDYVDLPLQHAHPETLRRMRRGGTAESHLRLLDRFRRAMADPALRSTFIVGFPGETEAEFEALLEFVEAAQLDHLGVFNYSHEESTAAFAAEDDVPAPVKQERRDRLMACQQRIAFAKIAARVGREVEVLVEGAHPETEHLLVGRMRGQAAEVDGSVLINDGTAAPGAFVRVELTEPAGYDVVGRILGPA